MATDVQASVAVQALDGNWETIGADKLANIKLSDLTMNANTSGPDKASFKLRRSPGQPWPDLSAFTPVDIHVGGVKVWSGRVQEAPSKEGDDFGLSVQCEGWQYHLDDDLFRRQWVINNLSDWKDSRQFINCLLTGSSARRASGSVTQDDGAIVISWPKGIVVENLQVVSIGIDLGPEVGTYWNALTLEYDWINAGGNGNQYVFAIASSTGPWDGASSTSLFSVNHGAADASYDQAVAWYGNQRYIEIGIQSLAGGIMNPTAADTAMRIKGIRLATLFVDGYNRATIGADRKSTLRASEVAIEAVARNAPKISVGASGGGFGSADRGAAQQYDANVLNDAPTYYWPMSESSGGSAYDASPSGSTGALLGGYTQSSTGGPLTETAPLYSNGYVDFNGTSGYMYGIVPSGQDLYGRQPGAASGPFAGITMDALVWSDTTSGLRTVIRQGNRWSLRMNAGNWEAFAWNGTAYNTVTGPAVSANRWYHVGFSVGLGILCLWVDGVVYSTSCSYTNKAGAGENYLFVGSAYGGSAEWWDGKISRVGIYNTAEPWAMVRDHYITAREQDIVRPVHTSGFAIPEFKMASYKTPREVITAVNAFHDWKTGVDAEGRFIFQPPRTYPTVEIGDWPGSQFEDASAGSGEDIYNRAIVEATGPDDSAVIVSRSSAQVPSLTYFEATTSPTINTFDTNTAGWTATGSTITRDTTNYYSSPAGGRWDNTGAGDPLTLGDTLSYAFTGSFLAGVTYRLIFRARPLSGGGRLTGSFGSAGDFVTFPMTVVHSSIGWSTFTMYWTPAATTSAATFQLGHYYDAVYLIDGLELAASSPTLVGRRQFRRTKSIPVSSTQTEASATQLADTFLKGHAVTPFRGSATIDSIGARHPLNGSPLHASQLLLEWGNRIRVAHHLDPDTGALGREGQIADVSYNHATQQASLTIDNRRQNFEAFIARLAAVQTAVGG